jgi:hypothetical protein
MPRQPHYLARQSYSLYSHCKDLVSFSCRPLTPVTYEQVCNETLDSLSEYFEEIIEEAAQLKSADVSYSVSNCGASLYD